MVFEPPVQKPRIGWGFQGWESLRVAACATDGPSKGGTDDRRTDLLTSPDISREFPTREMLIPVRSAAFSQGN